MIRFSYRVLTTGPHLPLTSQEATVSGEALVAETVVQKLWLRGDFDRRELRTTDGRLLRVLHPGRWNRLAGPDFFDARWEVDGKRVRGDVEVHFYAHDWRAHGHDRATSFRNVRLHVIVFPPSKRPPPVRTVRGREPDTLVLLPYLTQDLEAYAHEDALRALSGADPLELAGELLARPESERRRLLAQAARRRWRAKLDRARKLLILHGWLGACHRTCLEVLGYRRNREPMRRLAARYPLHAWSDVGLTTDLLLRAGESWQTHGVRPCNQPRKRLDAYLALCRHDPVWPIALLRWSETFLGHAPHPPCPTPRFRQTRALAAARERLARDVFHGTLGGTRLDTLLGDGLLPLLAAHIFERTAPAWWFHAFPGDGPSCLPQCLEAAGLTDRQHPRTHGRYQGALQLFLDKGGLATA